LLQIRKSKKGELPMHRIGLILIASIFLTTTAFAGSGLVSVKSHHNVNETADRLENILKAKGMKVFNRIDHSAGAKGVDIELRPTQLLVFGNPKVGAPLMQCGQTMAIDLPQKALIWEDESGTVWLTTNDPEYLAARHGIDGCQEVLAKVRKALENFATAATKP
jgi:uncharacterized protein (DUF302 family)